MILAIKWKAFQGRCGMERLSHLHKVTLREKTKQGPESYQKLGCFDLRYAVHI